MKEKKKRRRISIRQLRLWLTEALEFVAKHPRCEVSFRDFETEFNLNGHDEYQFLAVYSDGGITCTLAKDVGPNRIEKLSLEKVMDADLAADQIGAFLKGA